ncbi:large ribosomal subunit protein mL64-like isoform X2 [Clavelina lepadiformis]
MCIYAKLCASDKNIFQIYKEDKIYINVKKYSLCCLINFKLWWTKLRTSSMSLIMLNRVFHCKHCWRLKRKFFAVYQQTAEYLAPPLPETIDERLKKHRHMIAPKLDEVISPQFNPYYNADRHRSRLRRQLWAKYGSKSGVDTSTLFPSKETIRRETEAEIEWWPTLQQMQNNFKEAEALKQQKETERQEKIAENMAKMPKWIEEYHAEQEKTKQKELEAAQKKTIEVQQAQEKFGFEIPSHHPMLKKYMENIREKARKEKKAAQKQAFKERRKV